MKGFRFVENVAGGQYRVENLVEVGIAQIYQENIRNREHREKIENFEGGLHPLFTAPFY